VGPVNDDDAREAEVDSCGEEDGGDCYADELPVLTLIPELQNEVWEKGKGEGTYIMKGCWMKGLKCICTRPM
jgi:hypothetical protein